MLEPVRIKSLEMLYYQSLKDMSKDLLAQIIEIIVDGITEITVTIEEISFWIL